MALYRTGGSSVKFKTGTFTTGASAVHVDVGFKPKYLAIIAYKSNGTSIGISYLYNEDISTTKFTYSATDVYLGFRDLNGTSGYNLKSIDDDGFTINGYNNSSWRGPAYYFAIG